MFQSLTECSIDWKKLGNSCYHYENIKTLSWDDATVSIENGISNYSMFFWIQSFRLSKGYNDFKRRQAILNTLD